MTRARRTPRGVGVTWAQGPAPSPRPRRGGAGVCPGSGCLQLTAARKVAAAGPEQDGAAAGSRGWRRRGRGVWRLFGSPATGDPPRRLPQAWTASSVHWDTDPPSPRAESGPAGCACRGSFHGSRNRSALPGAGDLGAAARALHASAAPLGRARPCPRSVALTAGLLRGSPGEVSAELRKPGERLQPHPPGSEATVERRARRNRVQDERVCPEPDGPLSGSAALSGQRRPSRPPVPVRKAKAGP